MTVKELLTKADLYEIAKEEAKIELEEYDLKSENIIPFSLSDMTEKILKKYQQMLLISENKNHENIIVVAYTVDIDEDMNSFYDATLYMRSELLNKEFRHFDYMNLEKMNNHNLDAEKYVNAYAFEFEEWEDILGYEVAEESIERYGLNTVAKSILAEMTFFGFDYKKSSEQKKEEIKIIEERVKDIKDNPDRLKTFTSLDDLYERFGLKRPTPEERAERDLRWKMEAEINQKEKETIILKLQERLRKEK